MRVLHVVAETPLSFLQHLKDITYIERRPLRYGPDVFIARLIANSDATRFCAERLQSLIRTLELNRLDEYASLQKVASFATLVATYEKGRFHKPSQLSNSKIFVQAFCSFLSPLRPTTPQFQIQSFILRQSFFVVSHLPLK